MSKPGMPRKSKPFEKLTARKKGNGPPRISGQERGLSVDEASQEKIATRAYSLFLERGGHHGEDWGDWFRAEMELLQEKNS